MFTSWLSTLCENIGKATTCAQRVGRNGLVDDQGEGEDAQAQVHECLRHYRRPRLEVIIGFSLYVGNHQGIKGDKSCPRTDHTSLP